MSTNEFTSNLVNDSAKKINIAQLQNTALFLVLTIMGLVVFVFGTSYYDQSDTNTSGTFKLLISGIFLGSALFAGRMDNLKRFKRILYAFFVASCVNAVTWYFALYARDGLFE